MPYLLDGNNLIGAVRRTAKPSEDDRTALIGEIADRLRQTRARATLFFDGPAGARPTQLGALSVRVPSSSSADDAILGAVQSSGTPSECIVVTADRELSRRARDAGARVLDPAAFFARFGANGADGSSGTSGRPAGGARAPQSAAEIEEWLRYFEDDRNRD